MDNWPTSFKAWISLLSGGLFLSIGYACFSSVLVFVVWNGVVWVLNHPRFTPNNDFRQLNDADFLEMYGVSAILTFLVLAFMVWPPRRTKTQDVVVQTRQ